MTTLLTKEIFQQTTTNPAWAGDKPYTNASQLQTIDSVIKRVELTLNDQLNGALYKQYSPDVATSTFETTKALTTNELVVDTLYQLLTKSVEYFYYTGGFYVNINVNLTGNVNTNLEGNASNVDLITLRSDILADLKALGLIQSMISDNPKPFNATLPTSTYSNSFFTGNQLNELNDIINSGDWTFQKLIMLNGGIVTPSVVADNLTVNGLTWANLLAMINGKQEALTAGNGITIQNGIISASVNGGNLWKVQNGTTQLVTPTDLDLKKKQIQNISYLSFEDNWGLTSLSTTTKPSLLYQVLNTSDLANSFFIDFIKVLNNYKGDNTGNNFGTTIPLIEPADISNWNGKLSTSIYDLEKPQWLQLIGDNTTAIDAKQDKLTAGANITISANNVISAMGGSGGNSYWEIQNTVFKNLETMYEGAIPKINSNFEFLGRNGKTFISKKITGITNDQNEAEFLNINFFYSTKTITPHFVANIGTTNFIVSQNNTKSALLVNPILRLVGYDIDENLIELYITEILRNYDVTAGAIPVLPLITEAQVTQIGTNTTNINDNATDIATNIADINTNTTNIATNTANITTNTGKIATNESDIASNETNITNNLQELRGIWSYGNYRLVELNTINLPTNNYVNFTNFGAKNPILDGPANDITITNNDTLTFTEANASYLIKINHNVGSFLQFESNNQQNFQSVKNNINQLFVAPIGLTDGYLEIYLNTGSTTNTTLKMVSRSFNLAIDNVAIERVPTQPFNNYEWFKDINKGILFTKQSLSGGSTPIELFVASKLFTPTTTFTGYTFNSNNTITLPAGYRYRIELFDTGTVGGGNAVEWTITETQGSTTNTFTTDGSSTKTLIITTSNNQIRLTYGTNATAYGNHDINYNIIVLGRTF